MRERVFFSLKERSLLGYQIAACQYLPTGNLPRRWSQSLCSVVWWEEERNRHKILIGFREKFFHHEDSKAVD